MNLKLKLICALLFCFSFFNMIGQTKTETVQQGQDRLKNFVTKNDPADEPYRKELYNRYIESYHFLDTVTSIWRKSPNSYTHSIPELKRYYSEIHQYRNEPSSFKIEIGNYLETYCLKITKVLYNEFGQMIRDIEDCMIFGNGNKFGYGADNYFESCMCTPQAVGGVGVPPLFLVGEAPCSRGEFLNRAYKYYVVKRRDPEKWLEIINQKNTNGETILDFFKTLETHGNYNTDETRACIKEDIKFICEHGGVHAFGKGTKDDYCECLKNKALEKKQ